MEKEVELSVHLDPDQLVYYPGERLSGFVRLFLNEELEMKCLRVEFSGYASCQWRENSNASLSNANEKIVKKEACLFGSLKSNNNNNNNNNGQRFSHAAGEHSYPFAFHLPTDLPTSLEHVPRDTAGEEVTGARGYIRYMVTATIEQPWAAGFKSKRPVVINEQIDTNSDQYINGPGSELSEKSTSRCRCFGKRKKQDVEFAACVDRACYCSGEPILLNARISNRSSGTLSALRAEIRQEVRYKFSGRTKAFDSVLDDLKGPDIQKGVSLSWQNLPFVIPPAAPTISNSKVISVKYELRFRVELSSGKVKTIVLPLVIGTVPHQGVYGNLLLHNKMLPPALGLKDLKFPVPAPSIFSTVEESNLSLRSAPDDNDDDDATGETPTPTTTESLFRRREVVYGYCKPVDSGRVRATDEDEGIWNGDVYTPLYTYVKIAREIPKENDLSPTVPDPKHLINITV